MGNAATQTGTGLPETAGELQRCFDGSGLYTIGIEEELMLLDPASLDLSPCVREALELLDDEKRFKPELPASQLEIITRPYSSVGEAIDELRRSRRDVAGAGQGRFLPAGAGTHPFASSVGVMSEGAHYEQLVEDYGWAAVRGMAFGLHVHIAADDADRSLAIYNALRSYLPQIAALAGNSPFFDGEDTGLASVRPKLAEHFPRQGVPPVVESWDAYAAFLRWGRRTGAIRDAKHVWWELRLNPLYGTLEVRAPDTQLSAADTAGVAAFVHCLVAWLGARHDEGEALGAAPDVRIAENRWRALRYGLNGTLVDLETGEPVDTRERVASTIEAVAPLAQEVGCMAELAHARELLRCNGAERQRAVASELGLRGLTAWIAEQFL